jgi:hypothetical protein
MKTKNYIIFFITAIFLSLYGGIMYNYGYTAKHTPNYIYTNDHRSILKAMRNNNIEFTTEQSDGMFRDLGGKR